MAKSPKQSMKRDNPIPKARNDWDVMCGPTPKTTPAPIRPVFIPQRRLNVGMDRFP